MSPRWIQIAFWLYLLTLVWADATHANPADPDLWHRLALGEMLCQTGHFPTGGSFSYLADYSEIADHEWGSGVVFYCAYRFGGEAAIVLIKVIAFAGTIALLIAAGVGDRRPTLLLAAFYALVLLALLPSFLSTVRCMVFTNLFLALWLYWYQLERRGLALSTWAYVAVMVAWANLHGGFVIGLLWLLGVTLVQFAQGHDAKRWAMRFGACLLATLVNPFGWNLWASTARALVAPRGGFDEWAPVSWRPDSVDYMGYKLLVCVLFITIGLVLVRRTGSRIDRPALIFVGAALFLSFFSARHTALFAAVAGAFLPGFFVLVPPTIINRGANDRHRRLGWFALRCGLTILPFFAVLRSFPGEGLRLEYPPVSCPVKAVDFLQRENIRGNLLVPFNYGSYALWRLRGRMRVSMDGRYDLVYRPATYQRVDDFFFARGDWPQLLRSPSPAAVLLPVADPVYAPLEAQPDWREAYHDATDAVFLPR